MLFQMMLHFVLQYLVCFTEFSAANILFFNNDNQFFIKIKLNVNLPELLHNF